MKKLEELGISLSPWGMYQTKKEVAVTTREEGFGDIESALCRGPRRKSNARLIATAPKLYDAAERLLRFHDESCIHGNRTFEEITRDYQKAMKDLKTALAEASGESEVTNV